MLPSASKQCYRVWLDPSVPAAERCFSWKRMSKPDAWRAALKYVRGQ